MSPRVAVHRPVAGRGLALVNAVATRWDTSSTGSMSCVWFELSLGDLG